MAPPWLKAVPNRLKALLDTSGLPDVLQPFGRTPIANVDAPDAALMNDPVVTTVRPSVVKIRGVAPGCQKVLEGTGFVVAPNRVMSNAHVVAGAETVTVEADGQTYRRDGGVLRPERRHLDPRRARTCRRRRCRSPKEPAKTGTDAIVLGYPGGGDFRPPRPASARPSSSTAPTSTRRRPSTARFTRSEALCGKVIRADR